jgi:hypothetical protein
MAKLSPVMQKVNIKQRKFVREYVKTGNITQSAFEAYNHKTRNSAASHGSQLLKGENIQRAILEAMDNSEMSPEWILAKKKKLINKGMQDLEDSKVSPEVLNKSLDGLLKLYDSAGGGGLNTNKTLHLHQHYSNMTRDEVLKARQVNSQWFNDIIDDKE